MKEKAEAFAWFLGFLIITKVVVAPIVNGMVPKNAAGVPLFQL